MSKQLRYPKKKSEMPANVLECRPEVQQFALLMEFQLRRNDNREGWKGDSVVELLASADEHIHELTKTVQAFSYEDQHALGWDVAKDAVNTANMLMMVADVASAGMDVSKFPFGQQDLE